MNEKTVRETSVTMAQVMLPQDANSAGNVHGGVIMKLIDTAAAVVAGRHARSNTVTASIDRLDFLGPVFVGDLLFLKAVPALILETGDERRRNQEAPTRRRLRLEVRASQQ